MTLKIEMYLPMENLRRACIDNNWCNHMDNKQYDSMLKLCNNSPITLSVLIKISNRIVNGTYDYISANDVLDKLLNGGYVAYYHYAK